MVDRWGNGDRDGGTDRGLAPVFGLILLLGVVISISVVIFTMGISSVEHADRQVSSEAAELDLKQADKEITTLTYTSDNVTSVSLDSTGDGEYEVVDGGTLSIAVSDRFGNGCSADLDLGTLQYEDGTGDTMGYQAGGLWKATSGGSTLVSSPDLRYYGEDVDGTTAHRLEFAVTNVNGTASDGEHTASQRRNDESLSCLSDDEFGFASEITITVANSPFHDGWHQFLREEFDVDDTDNEIHADPENRTVTVTASLDYDRPFADYVDVEPTIYGGLYVSGDASQTTHRGALTVDAYDGSERTYAEAVADDAVSDDLFVVDADELKLMPNSEVAAFPVVNGDLRAQPNSELSAAALYAGEDRTPASHEDEVLSAELADPFDEVDAIDEEIAIAADHLETETDLDGSAATAAVDDGWYHVSGDLVRSGTVIDASDGDVHVAVEGDVDLDDVTVRGDGQVHVYANGSRIDVSDVGSDDDRASALWIYGTSDADVRVEEDFQGVVYAPDSGTLDLTDATEVDGAVIGGEYRIEDDSDVEIHFDESLRSAVAIPEENQSMEFEDEVPRDPIDVTFVLDASGSMGPHNPEGDVYTPTETEEITGGWQAIPVDEPFRNVDGRFGDRLQLRNDRGEVETLSDMDDASPNKWEEIRVHPDDCGWVSCSAEIGTYDSPGNDPDKRRVDATRNFVDDLADDDRAGVYQFDSDGTRLHRLSDDLGAVEDSVTGNAYGGTNMADGIELALRDHSDDDDRQNVMILLSDGQNSEDEYDEETLGLIEEAKDKDVEIYTVGLGFDDLDEELLERVSNETGGDNVNVDNASELEEVFEKIEEEFSEQNMSLQVELDQQPRESSNEYVIDIVEWEIELDEE